MDEFLFYYKPSKINQSLGFYQFTAMGKDCRLIKSQASSDRNWKMEFIFVSSFLAGNHVDDGRDPFAPYSRDLGNLHPKGTSFPFHFFYFFLFVSNPCLLFVLQVLNDHPEVNFTMTASTGLVFTSIGIFTLWLPYDVLPNGDLVLNHQTGLLLTRSQYEEVNFHLMVI